MRHVTVESRENTAIVRIDRPPANALAVVKAELSPPAARYLVMRARLIEPPEAEMRRVVESGTDPLAQSWLSAETGSAATAALSGEG